MQSQSKKTLFQRYQNSVTHSNANGKNNNFVYCAVFCLGLAVTVASLMKSLGFSNYSFKATFPIHHYTVMTVYTFGSTCFLWNSEFKDFLVRRVVSCTRLYVDTIFCSVAQKKIHPANHTSERTYRRGKSESNANKTERKIVAVDIPERKLVAVDIPLSILVVQEANQQI